MAHGPIPATVSSSTRSFWADAQEFHSCVSPAPPLGVGRPLWMGRARGPPMRDDTLAVDVLALVLVRFFVWQIEASCAHLSHVFQEMRIKAAYQGYEVCTALRRSSATPSVNHVRHHHAFCSSFGIARCSGFRRSRVELRGLESLLCGRHQRHRTHDSPAVRLSWLVHRSLHWPPILTAL